MELTKPNFRLLSDWKTKDEFYKPVANAIKANSNPSDFKTAGWIYSEVWVPAADGTALEF